MASVPPVPPARAHATEGEGASPATPSDLVTLPTSASSVDGWAEGATMGRFRIRRLLGAGGMGVVLEADDPELDRRVAIKVVHVGDGSRASVRRGRLVREARAAARLSHPNVITIHDVGTLADGHPFIAMELIEGSTLAEWQRARPPWRDVLERYLAAAQGLAAAHEAGLVHRDFKPHNVLLGAHGVVRVSDFGIAALPHGDEPAAAPEVARAEDGSALTEDGEVLGTPAYMPPEQRARASVDARADQYAFCVALYEGLTGALPFGEDPVERAGRASRDDIIAGHTRPGPRALYVVLARGMSSDPEHRFADMRALIAAIERVTTRRRRLAWAGVAVGALVASSAFWLGARSEGPTCDGGDAAWDQALTQETQPALAAAFAKAGAADPERAPRVTAALERWGQGLVAARRAACIDTRVTRVADEATFVRRSACLDSARAVAAGVITALRDADRSLTANALDIVHSLPRVEDCAEITFHAPRNAPAGSDELRRQLDATDLATTIGKLDAAIPKVADVLAKARRANDKELEALALVRLGRLQRRRGEMLTAAATLFDAAVAAEASDRHDLAAEAWAEWLFARSRDGDATTLAQAARRADAALARAGNPPALRAMILTNEGIAAYRQRDFTTADRLYRQALELREQLFGKDDPRVFDLLDNISASLDSWSRNITDKAEAQRKRDEAFEISRGALAAREKALGPHDLAVARSLQNLSGMVDARGQRAEARSMLRRALAIKEKALGPSHVELATTLNRMADFDEQEGDLEAALAGFERSLSLRVAAAGELASGAELERLAVAELSEALGRPAEAAAAFRALAKVHSKDLERQRAALRAAIAEVEAGSALAPARAEVHAIAAAWREDANATAAHRAAALLANARLAVLAKELDLATRDLDEAARLLGATPAPADSAAIAVTRAELFSATGNKARSRAAVHAARTACAARACETAGYSLLRRADRLAN